ncbi:PE-PGRS family protein [Streptomyces sp. RTd22]|uniref:PE-PGRS family protein n=1 Tax=Streptomyces sp. RTd22 TaxID=1841249 RepID=UPI000A4EE650|nr:PE-PGRS family protein [Streptomyces sp. RTd22]
MHAARKPDHDHSSDRSRPPARPAPDRATAKPDVPAGPGGSMTQGQMLALQRSVGNLAASKVMARATVTVQRAGESSASAAAAEQPAKDGTDVKGKEVIYRLSRSIESRAVESKLKPNVWAPGTWYPEKLMLEGKMRLRRTLDRRVIAGEVFTAQDLADIEALTTVNAQWLKDVGIGTIEDAKAYTAKGNYKDWLNLPAGKRVLTATLAYNNHLKGAPVPDAPDYTLGRFFSTQGSNLTGDQKQPLLDERDEQIRQTAVRTLHPAAIPPQDMHADANKAHVTQHQKKADKARDVFTNVLLVLQHGLKIYDKEQQQHLDYRDGDVVRALAHGGRVNIRIPALKGEESATSLTDFLDVTAKGKPTQFVEDRPYATHGMDIEKNKDGKRGKFKETSGGLVSVGNRIKPGGPDMWGLDVPGGGFGSKDWNGDVVLPTGSHGHMLLVFTAPTKEKDGSLLVGIETIGPDKPSPVGYKHDFRSTEATSNPESVLHGHKRDKIGSGGTAMNERYVDLKELGDAQGGGDWRAFLDGIKQGWYDELKKTTDGSDERQAMYHQLVGPRQHFYGQTD